MCQRTVRKTSRAPRALLIGASFIGLEVGAALRARGLEVHVVAPEKRPIERILGPEMGDFIRGLHEEHGVQFHLEDAVAAIDGQRAILKSGQMVEAELVVAGIGVQPRLALAEQAGLAIDRGVLVNEFLETSAARIYAAGDIARWPDPHSGENIRVEHWAVAERQAQTAALNMLGERQKFDAVPYFWSQHYDVPVNYIGHATHWDEIEIEGDISARDCLLKYKQKGLLPAVASIGKRLVITATVLRWLRGIRKALLGRNRNLLAGVLCPFQSSKPVTKPIQIKIDDRGRVKREQLGHHQPAYDGIEQPSWSSGSAETAGCRPGKSLALHWCERVGHR